jgi:Galactose oxidase, central domain/Kelch motif
VKQMRIISLSCLILLMGSLLTGGIAGHAQTAKTSGSWSPAADMGTARLGHQAVVLRTGKVLIIGGFDNNISLSSTELFSPRSGEWNPTGSMITSRSSFSATVLRNGKVLVVGGFNVDNPSTGGSKTAKAEIYDPHTGTWHAAAPMHHTREGHTATLLRDGTVLVVGGASDEGDGVQASAELYNPRTNTWASTTPMDTARFLHTATRLRDGRVLVIGGDNTEGTTDTAELYDPHTGSWEPAASLSTPRVQHGAALLQDGTVLVSGGCCYLDSAELYDPQTDTWFSTGDMIEARFGHTPTVLRNGRVLATGGCCEPAQEPSPDPVDRVRDSVELYNPRTGVWQAKESMSFARHGHTATLLRSGQVLVTGGGNDDGVIASVEIFTLAK